MTSKITSTELNVGDTTLAYSITGGGGMFAKVRKKMENICLCGHEDVNQDKNIMIQTKLFQKV